MVEKVYQAACPVCHAATELVAEFWSTAFYTSRNGEPHTRAYPSVPCPGLHTLAEVRAAIGLPVRPYEDPTRVVMTTGARLVAPEQAVLPLGDPPADLSLSPLAALARAFQAWDEVWGAVLRDVYGPEAGDARFGPRGYATPALRAVHDSREAARLAWETAREDFRKQAKVTA